MELSPLLADANIEIGNIEHLSFASKIIESYKNAKIIVLADENTYRFCWNKLIVAVEFLQTAELIIIPPGEENKTLDTCSNVWEILSNYKVGRHDLIINLGGGVITDTGGFIASVFKRGIHFINIPTTLLGMIDASFGGKTGVNIENYKNQLGVFNNPIATYIDKSFLYTLPTNHIKNGFAEIIKHALINDTILWERIVKIKELSEIFSDDIFKRALKVKIEIVNADPKELGLRKILNFGHTIGHAIEGHFFNFYRLEHGHAVALGMIAESYIATKIDKLSMNEFRQIINFIKKYFLIPSIAKTEITEIVELMKNDKKNYEGKIQCALIDKIGHCMYDQPIDEELITESLIFLFFSKHEV